MAISSTQGWSLVARAFLIGFFLFLTAILYTGSLTSGVSVDEELHMLFFRGLRWAADPFRENVFAVHGLSFQLLSHLVAVAVGIEPLGEIAISAQGFGVRHVVTATLTFATALCVGVIVYLITKKEILSLWGALALLAVPPFLGHGFFNPKDVPVAFGYTAFTLTSTYVLRSILVSKRFSSPVAAGVFALTAFATWLAVGTRFGMFYLFLATYLSVLALLVWMFRRRGIPLSHFRQLWPYLGGFIVGVGFVAITNPCLVARSSPDCLYGFEILPRFFSGVTGFPWPHQSFLAGRLVSGEDPDFWYLPVALAAGLPLGLTALAIFGFVFFWENHTLRFGSALGTGATASRWALIIISVPVILQLVVGPTAAILLRSTLYDAQRQHLYVYPATIVLAALGLLLVYQLLSRVTSQSWSLLLTGLTSLGVLVLPVYEAVRLFPYTYIYVNPLASAGGFQDNWETDYWGTAHREALRYVPEGANLEVAVSYWTVVPYLKDSRPLGQVDNETEKYVIQWHRVGWGDGSPPAECDLVHTVTRQLRGESLPMAYVSRCPIDYDSGALANYEEMRSQAPYFAK